MVFVAGVVVVVLMGRMWRGEGEVSRGLNSLNKVDPTHFNMSEMNAIRQRKATGMLKTSHAVLAA